MRTGEPAFVSDVTRDPDYVAGRTDVTSEICVPVKVDGDITAVLNVESTPDRPLSGDDFRLMLTLAAQLSLVMSNAALYGHLQKERDRVQSFNEQLLALQRVATAVSSRLNLRELLDYISRAAAELLDGDSSCILFSDENGLLTIHGGYGPSFDALRTTVRRIGEGINGHVAQTGEPIIIDDARTDARVTNPVIRREGFQVPHLRAGSHQQDRHRHAERAQHPSHSRLQ